MKQSKIDHEINRLIERALTGGKNAPISKTQQILNRLDLVEQALLTGLSHLQLATEFGWSIRSFENALARARKRHNRKIRPEGRTPPRPEIAVFDQNKRNDSLGSFTTFGGHNNNDH